MKLNRNFLAELFKLFYSNNEIASICSQFLRYEIIPKELSGYKILLKEGLFQFREAGVIPSLGVVAQKYIDKEEVQQAILEVNKANLVDKELIIDQFEEYLRDSEFRVLNQRIVDLYQKDKKEEAIALSAEESARILSLSVRGRSGKFLGVFRDFETNMAQNAESFDENSQQGKIPFGIDILDDLTKGGVDRVNADTVLWIMRSGVGKSTVLRHHGLECALNGLHVLHIQLEGTKKEVFNKYSQMWTNSSFFKIQRAQFTDKEWEQFRNTIKEMESWKRDVDVYSFEKFGEASVIEIRNIIMDYRKDRGYYPDVLIVDSLDLLITGENRKMDLDPSMIKYKLQKCAQRLKDIAVEFNLVCFTATQTGDVPIEIWDDPARVIDRSFTEGDKTLVKPFSFVFTGNVTREEAKNNVLRIYADKLRSYSAGDRIFKIKTDYARGKFYDRLATMNMSKDEREVVRSKRKRRESQPKEDSGSNKMTLV